MEILYCEDNQIKNLAKAIVKYFNIKKLKKILLVGIDGNVKCNYVLSVLQTILLKNNVEIHFINTCTYPCLKYISKNNSYPLCLMLGVDNLNNKVEFSFYSNNTTFNLNEFLPLLNKKFKLVNNKFAIFKNVENLKHDYYSYLKNFMFFNFPIILDCTNPAINEVCNNIFLKHHKTHNKDILKSLCVQQQKYGFYFDKYGTKAYIIEPNNKKLKIQNQKDGILSAILTANTIDLQRTKHH